MCTAFGNMLGDLGDKIKRIKDLKVTTYTSFECLIARIRKLTAIFMLSLIDDMVGVCQFYNPFQTERTSAYA